MSLKITHPHKSKIIMNLVRTELKVAKYHEFALKHQSPTFGQPESGTEESGSHHVSGDVQGTGLVRNPETIKD